MSKNTIHGQGRKTDALILAYVLVTKWLLLFHAKKFGCGHLLNSG